MFQRTSLRYQWESADRLRRDRGMPQCETPQLPETRMTYMRGSVYDRRIAPLQASKNRDAQLSDSPSRQNAGRTNRSDPHGNAANSGGFQGEFCRLSRLPWKRQIRRGQTCVPSPLEPSTWPQLGLGPADTVYDLDPLAVLPPTTVFLARPPLHKPHLPLDRWKETAEMKCNLGLIAILTWFSTATATGSCMSIRGCTAMQSPPHYTRLRQCSLTIRMRAGA
jgi:hypothetical protein